MNGLNQIAGARTGGNRSHLTCISHHLPAEARNRPAITLLRLVAVLNVLSEYASARQPARASY